MLNRDLKVIGTVVGVLDNAYVDVLPESYLPAKMFQNAQCLPRTTPLARELLQERCQSKAKVAINYFTGSSLMESIKEDCSLTSRRCHFGLFSASNDEWLVPCTTTGPVMRDTVCMETNSKSQNRFDPKCRRRKMNVWVRHSPHPLPALA